MQVEESSPPSSPVPLAEATDSAKADDVKDGNANDDPGETPQPQDGPSVQPPQPQTEETQATAEQNTVQATNENLPTEQTSTDEPRPEQYITSEDSPGEALKDETPSAAKIVDEGEGEVEPRIVSEAQLDEPVDDKASTAEHIAVAAEEAEPSSRPEDGLDDETHNEDMHVSDGAPEEAVENHRTTSNVEAILPTDADVDHIQMVADAKVGEHLEGLLDWSGQLRPEEPDSPARTDSDEIGREDQHEDSEFDPTTNKAALVVDLVSDSEDSASSQDDPDKENDGSLVNATPRLEPDLGRLSISDHGPSHIFPSRHSLTGPLAQSQARRYRREQMPAPNTWSMLPPESPDVSATELVQQVGRRSLALQTQFYPPSRRNVPYSSTPLQNHQHRPSTGNRSLSFSSVASSATSTSTRKRRSSGFMKRNPIHQKQHDREVEVYHKNAILNYARRALAKANALRRTNRLPQMSEHRFFELALKRREIAVAIGAEDKNASWDHFIMQVSTRLARQKENDARSVLPLPPAKLAERERLKREERLLQKKLRGVLGRKQLPAGLSEEQDKAATLAFRQPGTVAVIPGAEVNDRDVQKLRPGQWLNDEVINFYGNLILLRANEAEKKRTEALAAAKDAPPPSAPADKVALSKTKRPNDRNQPKQPYPQSLDAFWRVHFFSSFFWENLKNRGYDGVKRWTRRIDIFSKDIILFPINLGNSHWVCAAINMRKRRFEYYDSMGAYNSNAFKLMRMYVAEEAKDKKKKEIDLRGWKDWFSDDSPQQENGYDCGVFSAQTLEQISRRDYNNPIPLEPPVMSWKGESLEDGAGKISINGDGEGDEDDDEEYEWNFAQENMPYLRRRMAYEIFSKKLLD